MMPRPVHAAEPLDRPIDSPSEWDLILPATPSIARPRDSLHEGVEEILERLRASDARREGAMARLESMLDQWPESQRDVGSRSDDQASPVPESRAHVYVGEHGVPSLALFDSESSDHRQKTDWPQTRDARMPPARPTDAANTWSPHGVGRLRAALGRDDDAGDDRSSADAETVERLAGRLDSVELAVVVAKEELARAKVRMRTLERRSSATLTVLLFSIILAGILMFALNRRLDDANARATAAQPQRPNLSRGQD